MFRWSYLVLLLGVTAGGGCTQDAPVDRPGASANPPTIMSMNPCIDAILEHVADPAQIVSISHLSHDPGAASASAAWARRFPANYGTAEEVIAVRPDLVFIGPHVARPTVAAIHRAGVRTAEIGVPTTIEQSLDQVAAVADASGHPARGRRLAKRIVGAINTSGSTASAPVSAIVWQGGLVPGEGTLMDELLTRSGFVNRSRSYGLSAWDMLPMERLIADPPDIILSDALASAAQGGGDLGAGARRLTQISAVEPFGQELLYCAGPNLIAASRRLQAIASAYRAVND